MPKWPVRYAAGGWNLVDPPAGCASRRAGTRDLKLAYYVYVLLSEKDNKLYVGQTKDLDKRIKEHNAGKVFSTRHRKPLILVYKESASTRTEAVKKEKYYKTQRGRQKLKLILKTY